MKGEGVDCAYCGTPAELLSSKHIDYPYSCNYGPVWACTPCSAWCGCHPHTTRPLGRLADAKLRAAKQQAHAAFDPLWKRKMAKEGCGQATARRAGYLWLSAQLALPPERTHIGEFDIGTCQKVVAVCTPFVHKGFI